MLNILIFSFGSKSFQKDFEHSTLIIEFFSFLKDMISSINVLQFFSMYCICFIYGIDFIHVCAFLQ